MSLACGLVHSSWFPWRLVVLLSQRPCGAYKRFLKRKIGSKSCNLKMRGFVTFNLSWKRPFETAALIGFVQTSAVAETASAIGWNLRRLLAGVFYCSRMRGVCLGYELVPVKGVRIALFASGQEPATYCCLSPVTVFLYSGDDWRIQWALHVFIHE